MHYTMLINYDVTLLLYHASSVNVELSWSRFNLSISWYINGIDANLPQRGSGKWYGFCWKFNTPPAVKEFRNLLEFHTITAMSYVRRF